MRHAVVADADEIARVHRLSRADYYGAQPDQDDDRQAMWTQLIAQEERSTWAAEVSGVVVGFLSARHASTGRAELELTAIYVLPAQCGHGVGSRLYEQFEQERRSDESGVLEVWAGNRRAIDFYRSRGWRSTSVTRPGPQDSDFVTYRLPAL